MKRKEFTSKVIRLSLLSLLGLFAIILGRRATTKGDCNSCPQVEGCTSKNSCPL